MKYNLLIYLFLTVWFIIISACSQNNTKLYKDLTEAEECMWKQPEKALNILQNINKDSIADKLNYATWCLLYTQAQDRNYITHSSDSLISIALDFFMKQDNPKRKAEAWFYKGQVKADQKLIKEAIECYVIAKEWAKNIDDDPIFVSLIHNTLGSKYRYQKLYNEAINETKIALSISQELGKNIQLSNSLSELGRNYAELGMIDSALYFFHKSLANAHDIKNKKVEAMVLGEIGTIYRAKKQYESALGFAKQSLYINKEINNISALPQNYHRIGAIYFYINLLDSAQYYFEKSLQTQNLYTIRSSYNALYQIAEEKQDFKQAIQYNNLYMQYNDSIMSMAKTKDIAEIQQKFDNERLIKEKAQRENYILYIIIVSVCVLSLTIFLYQIIIKKNKARIKDFNNKIFFLSEQIKENTSIITEKENTIQKLKSLTSQDKKKISSYNHQIEEYYKEIDYYKSQNQYLNSLLEENKSESKQGMNSDCLLEIRNNQIKQLKNNNKALMKFLQKNYAEFSHILNNIHYTEDYTNIISLTDSIYNGFSKKLQISFPTLTDKDIIICCLIKLKFSIKQIATMESVEPSSISKKKQRIGNKIKQVCPDWNKGGKDLDEFIEEWG
ncbi:MAG: hypothetical protein SOR57_11265 [Parabacteroides sp.]|nr:hypothetical protein [Parabacteroides sp.]